MVSKLLQDDISITKIQEKIVKPIVERFDPIQVILFGSRARGDMHDYSDIDVMVILDGVVSDKWRLKADALNTIEPGIGADTGIHISTPEEVERYKNDTGYIYYYVLRDGVILYER